MYFEVTFSDGSSNVMQAHSKKQLRMTLDQRACTVTGKRRCKVCRKKVADVQNTLCAPCWDTWLTDCREGLVNHIYSSLTDARFYRDLLTGVILSDFLPWQVSWLLRDLTRLAETDRTLAYVGIGHLCFLLPLLMQDRPVNWPSSEPYRADILHIRAVKAYRAQVRFYREQGKNYDEAQRLAL